MESRKAKKELVYVFVSEEKVQLFFTNQCHRITKGSIDYPKANLTQ
jgi:hypothetical protein